MVSLLRLSLAAFVLVVTILVSAKDESDITCNQSGMCSLGKTEYFYGSIQTNEGFKDALKKVSYKNEVILVTTYGSYFLEFVFQLHNQFRRLGMSHFLALSMKEEGCQEVVQVGRADKKISCAWDDSPQHSNSWEGGPLLSHLRWRFLARAARIGYNVMSLDSDYMVLQDPYVFLKAPPLGDAQLLSTMANDCGMDGGFAYIQNTKSDGPVAWLYHRTTEVPLRWMDDDYKHTNAWGKKQDGMCMTFDQAFLDDSFHSVIAGRPISATAWNECADPSWETTLADGTKLTKQQAWDRQTKLVDCQSKINTSTLSPPSFPAKPSLGDKFNELLHIDLKLPNNGGPDFPTKLGPPIFSDKGGKYSDYYFQQLKADCDETRCPPFKDTKADDAASAPANNETFYFVPTWLTSGASNLNHGFLTPLDGSRPRQVMVHFHSLASVRREWRASVSKIYGGFDWKLSRYLHSDPEANKKLAPGPYMAGVMPERVLVMSPYVVMSMAKDLREFKRITAGLVQVALMANRTIVYPDIPCKAPWVHKHNNTDACDDPSKLLSLHDENMPYGARDEPTNKDNLSKQYRIFSAFLADEGCMSAHAPGMMNMEFEEWVRTDCPLHNANGPWNGNTIFHMEKRITAGVAGGDLGEYVMMVDEDEMGELLKKFETEALVYLGHPVVVDMSQGDADGSKYNNWKNKFNGILEDCSGLYYTPYKMEKEGASKVSDYIYGAPAKIEGKTLLFKQGNITVANELVKKWEAAEREVRKAEPSISVNKGPVHRADKTADSFNLSDGIELPPINGSSCEGSGLCSLGKTKHFFGEVKSSSGFKTCVESVSYKKEIILISAFGAYFLEFVFQVQNQFRKFGMDHFLIISITNDGCQEVKDISEAALPYPVNCAWDDSAMKQSSWGRVANHLWHIRWRFIARVARVGYNILALDSDYLILQDPYAFLKRPPLSSINLMGVEEHRCGMNGGFTYMQNVRPDGPVSWIFNRATEMPLRWMDDDMKFLMDNLGKMKSPNAQMCMTFDQSFLDDALHSTMLGMPITHMVMVMCTDPGWKAKGPKGATQRQAIDRQMSMYKCNSCLTSFKVIPPNGSWPSEPRLPSAHYDLRVAKLRVPNWNGTLDPPPELGGGVFSRDGGAYTDAYFKQLREDCPDDEQCPWWKSDFPEDEPIAAATNELFAIVPKWFSTSASWLNHGYLTPVDGSKPRQAMVHFHVMGFEANEWKAGVGKVYGAYDWDFSRMLHKNESVDRKLAPGPYFMGAAPKKVILLHPSIDLRRTRDLYEYKRIVAGLRQLAIITNRTVVYPDLHCETVWLHKHGKDGARLCREQNKLLHPVVEALPYASKSEPWNLTSTKKNIKLFYSFFADIDCLRLDDARTGLLGVEYEEWVANDIPLLPGGERPITAPTPANTVFSASADMTTTATRVLSESILSKIMSVGSSLLAPKGKGDGVDARDPLPGFLVDSMLMLRADEVAAELAKYDGQAVLYVGTPVLVDQQTKILGNPKWNESAAKSIETCRAIHFIFDGEKKLWVKNKDVVKDFIKGLKGKIVDGKLERVFD